MEKGLAVTLATLVPAVLKASIVLTVLAFGLGVRRGDVQAVFRDPWKPLRSFVAMDVVMPLLAFGLAMAFDLNPAVKVALVTLSVSPVPPLLPRKELKAGGSGSYAAGLFATSALVSVLTVPLVVRLVGRVTGDPLRMAPEEVATLVVATVLGPLAAGIAIRRVAPAFAQGAATPLSVLAMVLLVAACVPLLLTARGPVMSLVGNGTLLAIGIFTLVGLVAGHLLGGPERRDRVVLALSTASRHPGVAIAAGAAIAPGEKRVFAAVLLYLLVSAVLSAIYLRTFGRIPSVPVEPDASEA